MDNEKATVECATVKLPWQVAELLRDDLDGAVTVTHSIVGLNVRRGSSRGGSCVLSGDGRGAASRSCRSLVVREQSHGGIRIRFSNTVSVRYHSGALMDVH
jgi:hypothetical protein